MTNKKYKLKSNEIKQLVANSGACLASDKITVNGELVGYMYREKPDFKGDTGWRFFSGTETQTYADNPDNFAIYDTNTIANYDPSIIPNLKLPVGSELERIKETTTFKLIN